MNIVVEKITPRIQYVFQRIEDFRLGLKIQLFEIDADFPSNSYRYQRSHSTDIGLTASDVLYDTEIKNYQLSKENFMREECLAFDRIVDPLAAIFYHLTRMEEYHLQETDAHGRFQSKNSFLADFNWMKKLMVERWIDVFIEHYQQVTGEAITNQKSSLKFTLTIDIDNTFAFRWKPVSRIIGSYIKDFLRFDFSRISSKTTTLLLGKKDPYDTYEIIQNYKKQGIPVQLFWLLGDLSPHDRNVSNSNKKHLTFIRDLSQNLSIGLHPSYVSNCELEALRKEKSILENTLSHPVVQSRQHFLKLQFPSTYQRNIEVGLEEDYTMGFGDQLGFRAGTLRSFPFFDLSKNQVEDYLIHPFAYMDGTLHDYLHLTISESKEVVSELIEEAKKHGGNFIAIWHNETLSDWGNWNGWKEVLETTIQEIHETHN